MKAQPSYKNLPRSPPAEGVVTDIRWQPPQHFLAEDKVRIVFDGGGAKTSSSATDEIKEVQQSKIDRRLSADR